MVIINLKALQQQFLSALADPLLADKALQIYQGSVQGNLQAILRATFPVCCLLVGDDFFRQLVKGYIAKTQHVQPDITHYGEAFPSHIEETVAVHQLCYLAEVAKLEWACHYAVNGPSVPLLDKAALAAVPIAEQSQIHFALYQNSTLIHSPYPILRIWQANQAGYEADELIHLSEGETYLLVHLRAKSLCLAPLTTQTFKMLTYFLLGMPFEAVCQQCHEDDPLLDIPGLFADCVNQQYIVDFSVEPFRPS